MKRAIMLSALALTALSSAWGHETAIPADFEERLGARVPAHLEFLDETGATASLDTLVDRPTILVFEYYDCTDGCGLLLANLATTLGRLDSPPGEDYRVITVSFDPEDTPARATEKKALAVSILGSTPPGDAWRFLSGDRAAIDALAQAVGFHYERSHDGFAHPLGLVFLSPQGKVVRYIRGERFLPADLQLSLMEASTGTLGPTISRIARFCFRVEPEGRGLTFNTLKVTGVVTLAAAALMLVVVIRKGRGKRRAGGDTV